MRIVTPSTTLLALTHAVTGESLPGLLESCARTAYRSEPEGAPEAFLTRLLTQDPPHESVIEHASATIRIVTDRGVTHELVRHRIGMSYTQESTRYCNYSKGRFGSEIAVVVPFDLLPVEEDSSAYLAWQEAMADAERHYLAALANGRTAQAARGLLPHDLAAEIVVTGNFRAWKHFLRLRLSPRAHPAMQHIAGLVRDHLHAIAPCVFPIPCP